MVEGQKNVATTIILIRHAEKDTSDNNRGLTDAGKLRAKKLMILFPNAQPDEMYATPYKRTFQTLQPWAGKLGLTIKPYSPGSLADFANQLLHKKVRPDDPDGVKQLWLPGIQIPPRPLLIFWWVAIVTKPWMKMNTIKYL